MKKRIKAMISLLFGIIFLLGSVGTTMTANAEDVKISTTNYKVSYKGSAENTFLCNKSAVSTEVGTEIYLTYTVEKLSDSKASVHGVGASGNLEQAYPYQTGLMHYTGSNKPVLMQEGYTYFYKFTTTEDGFTYNIIKAKGDDASYVDLPSVTGRMTDKLSYFGIWLGAGKVTAELKNVRCYDRNGNDLGVQFSLSRGGSVVKDVSYVNNVNLNHAYKVTIDKQHSVALCSGKPTKSNTVYMEYKVASSKSNIIQIGAMITQNPTTIYPYSGGDGYMLCNTLKEEGNTDMLMPGAEYIVCMEKKADDFSVMVQRTYEGKKEIFSFPHPAGTYGTQFQHFGLWFGTGSDKLVDAVLTDFKCYDDQNNNLGLQCNRTFKAEHYGEIEDYTGCEAVYYCKDNDGFIYLYEDQTMKITKGSVTSKGTYYITDAKDKTITLTYGGGKEGYDYLYKRITSKDGKVYERLGNYKVTFVIGANDAVETQNITAKTGYLVTEPEAPTKEKNTFKEWVTKDGKTYDFNTVVTKSITLYAKWVDEEGRETVAIPEGEIDVNQGAQKGIVIPIIAAAILVVCAAGCVLLIGRGGKKHEKNA